MVVVIHVSIGSEFVDIGRPAQKNSNHLEGNRKRVNREGEGK